LVILKDPSGSFASTCYMLDIVVLGFSLQVLVRFNLVRFSSRDDVESLTVYSIDNFRRKNSTLFYNPKWMCKK